MVEREEGRGGGRRRRKDIVRGWLIEVVGACGWWMNDEFARNCGD
jgi:hypothetical protein